MEWVSSWIQGIIIAVIISTIIEMILPEGNNKKYIKVVIGVYILFSIVSPVITKVTGNDFRVSDIFDLDEYIEASKNSGTLQNKIENQNENQIKEIYLSSIKSDIKEKVENKGYVVNTVDIEIEDNEEYTLKKISLQISKTSENKNLNSNIESNNNSISQNIVNTVNEVEINVDVESENLSSAGNVDNSSNTNNSNNSANSGATKDNNTNNKANSTTLLYQEKKNLKEYLSSVYEINIKNIFINE